MIGGPSHDFLALTGIITGRQLGSLRYLHEHQMSAMDTNGTPRRNVWLQSAHLYPASKKLHISSNYSTMDQAEKTQEISNEITEHEPPLIGSSKKEWK